MVLEFSSSLALRTLPFYQQALPYEGLHIPGSPYSVHVAANPAMPAQQPLCEQRELGTSPGEWVLQASASEVGPARNFTAASHAWEPHTCRLPASECLQSWARSGYQSCLPAGGRILLVMIGVRPGAFDNADTPSMQPARAEQHA